LRARIPFEDLQASDAKLGRLQQRGEAYQHEFRLHMPDGSVRWLSGHAAIRSNRKFGVNFDVTERKFAEEALRESEARLRIATSGAALGVSDRTIWVNDRMYEIFGRSRADGSLSRQQFVDDYLHPDDAYAFEEARQDALRTGGNFHAVCRIRRKSELRWLQFDGKFEFADTGEPSRLVGVLRISPSARRWSRRRRSFPSASSICKRKNASASRKELHDSTAQHLVAANLNLMSLRSKAVSGSEEAELWDEVEASMQEALKELRTFSYLMHPPTLHADGLRSTIRQYIDGYANRSGLVVKLRASPKVDKLPFRLQRSLLRIVQEALANVHRHASASHVAVDLRRIAGRLHLIVADDGHAAWSACPRVRTWAFRRGSRHSRDQSPRAAVRRRSHDSNGLSGTTVHAVVRVGHARRRKAPSRGDRRGQATSSSERICPLRCGRKSRTGERGECRPRQADDVAAPASLRQAALFAT
jgi:PAS domain-containing protein